MCQMTDDETVAYARAGMTYTEQNLWDDYCNKPDATGSWEDCKEFLLLRVGSLYMDELLLAALRYCTEYARFSFVARDDPLS